MHKEDMTFFLALMNVCKFRRCVFDEVIEIDNKGCYQSIYIVYTGQVGVQVDGLKDYTNSQ